MTVTVTWPWLTPQPERGHAAAAAAKREREREREIGNTPFLRQMAAIKVARGSEGGREACIVLLFQLKSDEF